MKELLLKLHAIGAIQFSLSKDRQVPYKVNLHSIISHPKIAKSICEALWSLAEHFHFDILCGTPIVGQALATYLAWQHDRPLVVRRVDIKDKEMHHVIEGSYKTGQNCLLITDVLNSHNSLLTTIEALQNEGLIVKKTLSFIDLESDSRKKIKRLGLSPHYVLSREDLLHILFDAGKIPGDVFKFIGDYLEQNGRKTPQN